MMTFQLCWRSRVWKPVKRGRGSQRFFYPQSNRQSWNVFSFRPEPSRAEPNWTGIRPAAADWTGAGWVTAVAAASSLTGPVTPVTPVTRWPGDSGWTYRGPRAALLVLEHPDRSVISWLMRSRGHSLLLFPSSLTSRCRQYTHPRLPVRSFKIKPTNAAFNVFRFT